MEQIHDFSSGGYVVHRITGAGWSGRASAWYDADGKLTAAEQFDRANRPRPVKRGGPMWRELQRRAARYGAAAGK